MPFEEASGASAGPRDSALFARDLAERINGLIRDPERGRKMGEKGRARVLRKFSWKTVAERTLALYESLI